MLLVKVLIEATSPRFSRTGGDAPDTPKTGVLCQSSNPISERIDSRVVNAFYARLILPPKKKGEYKSIDC